MAKNPLLQKKYQEGYNDGFKKGFEQGKYSACEFFAKRFEGLEKVKGIGPKTMKIIVEHFGREYFKLETFTKTENYWRCRNEQ